VSDIDPRELREQVDRLMLDNASWESTCRRDHDRAKQLAASVRSAIVYLDAPQKDVAKTILEQAVKDWEAGE